MKILLTNDDGFYAEGIKELEKELKKFGEVFVCAPKEVQSGKSNSILINKPLKIEKIDSNHYIVDGSPCDCVIFALSTIKEIDLVVSGCNDSSNLSIDTIYSGTCAGAIQANIASKKAISFSLGINKEFSQIKKYTNIVMKYILDNNLLSTDYFLNVNFPVNEILSSPSIKMTELLIQKVDYFEDKFDGNEFVGNRNISWDCDDVKYDVGAVNKGYVSISKLQSNYSYRK